MFSYSKCLTTVACLFLANQAFADLKDLPCPSPDVIQKTTTLQQAVNVDGQWRFYGTLPNIPWYVSFTKNVTAQNESEALEKGRAAFQKLALETPRRADATTCYYSPEGADYTLAALIAVLY